MMGSNKLAMLWLCFEILIYFHAYLPQLRLFKWFNPSVSSAIFLQEGYMHEYKVMTFWILYPRCTSLLCFKGINKLSQQEAKEKTVGWVTEEGRDEKEACRSQEQREPHTHMEHILETDRDSQRTGVFTRFLKSWVQGRRAAQTEKALQMSNHVKQWYTKHFFNFLNCFKRELFWSDPFWVFIWFKISIYWITG